MDRSFVAKELRAIAELLAYKPSRKKRKPQRGKEKKQDQAYYKKNKAKIRKQQQKYYKKNKKKLNKRRKSSSGDAELASALRQLAQALMDDE